MIIEPPSSDDPMLPRDAFAGRVAVVTGGGSGTGLAMASGFARCGATIAILGRNADRLAAGAAVLQGIGATVATVTADVRNPDEIGRAFDTIVADHGPIDFLANNAGSNFEARADALTPNGWRAILQIALDGTFFCCREYHKRRRTDGSGGAIVNNLASYAWAGLPGGAHSAAAKAGVASLTRSLATEWAPDGIRVNGILIGTFPHAGVVHHDPALPEGARGATVPARRAMRAQELGWAAAFLCSPWAGYVTGQMLPLDGGDSLRRGIVKPPFVPIADRRALWLD